VGDPHRDGDAMRSILSFQELAMNARALTLAALVTLFGALPVAAQTEEVVYYHTDAIGSVRMTTGPTGAVLERYDFLPFGEVWDTPAPEERQFAAKENDAETGLDYFGARYLRAQSGRFTSVDPYLDHALALADPQRWNRYSYALNNPLKFIDPDGRNPMLLQRLAEAAQRLAAHPTVQRAQSVAIAQGNRAWIALTKIFNSSLGQDLLQTGAEIATDSSLGSSAISIRSGVIERAFSTRAGMVSMVADAVVSGKSLHLKDIAIFPTNSAKALNLGAKGVMELLKTFGAEARQNGFTELRITGHRVSGANPGKQVDVLIDLTKEFR
jgi:RHS repeat-associated protein